jgi:hypothetical protein
VCATRRPRVKGQEGMWVQVGDLGECACVIVRARGNC